MCKNTNRRKKPSPSSRQYIWKIEFAINANKDAVYFALVILLILLVALIVYSYDPSRFQALIPLIMEILVVIKELF